MKALDVMPQLRVGVGSSPTQGGCVIQVASYLWNGEWRDDTPCVHPVLRRAAIIVNDSVADETRQKLYPLIPRLMGTASSNRILEVALAVWGAKKVQHLATEAAYPSVVEAIKIAERWLASPIPHFAVVVPYVGSKVGRDEPRSAAFSAAYFAASATHCTAAYLTHPTSYPTSRDADLAVESAFWACPMVDRYQMLVGLLDEYDRLTGRTEPYPVQDDEWQAVQCIMASA